MIGRDPKTDIALLKVDSKGKALATIALGDSDGAIDALFLRVDAMLSAGQFDRCDTLLQTIDVQRLYTNLLVAVLSVTKRAADRLTERVAFVRRVRARLTQVAPDRAQRLMAGLA